MRRVLLARRRCLTIVSWFARRMDFTRAAFTPVTFMRAIICVGRRRWSRSTRGFRGSFIRLRHLIRNALARDLELDEPFNLLQEPALFHVAERNRVARLARTRGTSDAVDVRLRLHRKVVVHDVRDIVDIKSACSHVSRNQHG